MTIEGLEGRVHFTFNGFIAGHASGSSAAPESFVFSTTGQAAKHWAVNWGDGSAVEPFDAPDQIAGWTSPVTFSHQFAGGRAYAVTADATSITNVTATAVPLGENSSFGNGGGTGKEVQALADGASVLLNIASVVDENFNTYVLSVDGKRMAVTRFKPDGTIDSGVSGWTSSGTFQMGHFTTETNQDTPKAMAIDLVHHYLYVAGGSNNKWAIGRIDHIDTTPSEGWKDSLFTGSATALWVDTSPESDGETIGVAGTTSSSTIAMTAIHAWDNTPLGITGGDVYSGFGTSGLASASNSIYAVPAPYSVTAAASAIVEADDVGIGSGSGDQWFVSGTMTYCCPSCTPSTGSDMVLVQFDKDGQLSGSGWGNDNGATLFNTSNSCCVVGPNSDSDFALVGSTVSGTEFITLAGGSGGSVLTERFVASTGLRDTTYGDLKGAGPDHKSWSLGPTGTAYAAVLDATPGVNKVVISGSGGSNDFLAARFKNDGTLDGSFGSSGSIRIDFGSTSGITTDGGKAIVMRSLDGGTTFDILVAGYTLDASTGKYKIALVDLLDDHLFHVT